jgi:hypothetical protein
MANSVLGNLRNSDPSTGGKPVSSTKNLNGVASKDSLHGKNSLKEYTTTGPVAPGPLGGKPSRK